jgi:thiamine pyrophosphate-dependent acetolactate synthase large subunit-like protein
MLVEGLPSFATDSPKIDYAAVASAMGIHAVCVETPTDVRAALRDALTHQAPALVDLVTDPRACAATEDHRQADRRVHDRDEQGDPRRRDG